MGPFFDLEEELRGGIYRITSKDVELLAVEREGWESGQHLEQLAAVIGTIITIDLERGGS